MNDEVLIYKIPNANLSKLNDRIELLNRKARKLGVAEIKTKLVKVELIEGKDEYGKVFRRLYHLEVEGISIKLPGGWTFLGTLEHAELGNVIRSIPGVELDWSWRSVAAKCDHCRTKRARKDTYLVRNESGEIKQVGHSCVRDYLGHVDPNFVMLLAQFVREFQDASSGEYDGGGKRVIDRDHFMHFAAELVRTEGYISKKSDKTPTSQKALQYMFPTPEMRKQGDMIYPTDVALTFSKEVQDWIKSLDLIAKRDTRLDPSGDFLYSVSIILSKDFLDDRDLGYAAAAFAAYQREQGEISKRKLAYDRMQGVREKAVYVGEIGKRMDKKLTLVLMKGIETQFGNSCLYKFEDESGAQYTWFSGTMLRVKLENASPTIPEGYDWRDAKIGDAAIFRFTIKEHELYKDIKQNKITRVAFKAWK